MSQAKIPFTQDEGDQLGQIFNHHHILNAVLIYECDDGSKAHITVLDQSVFPTREAAAKVKNLTAINLAKKMIGDIEAGDLATTYMRTRRKA